jgi:hypothetical protein
MGPMPPVKITRGVGPVTAALAAYDIWRRLPPKQRQWLTQQARHHGPRIAKQALEAQRNRRRS